MALQQTQHPDYTGVEVDPGDAERALRLLRFFLREGERVTALATTVKALPTLTHIAVTDRRVLGFSVADLAKDGVRQETDIAAIASVETRRSYKQRWFFVVLDGAGAETDFGDVHDQDAPRLTQIIQNLVRSQAPPRPAAAVPPPRTPAPPPAAPVAVPLPPATVPAASPPAGWRYNPPPTWPAPPPAGRPRPDGCPTRAGRPRRRGGSSGHPRPSRPRRPRVCCRLRPPRLHPPRPADPGAGRPSGPVSRGSKNSRPRTPNCADGCSGSGGWRRLEWRRSWSGCAARSPMPSAGARNCAPNCGGPATRSSRRTIWLSCRRRESTSTSICWRTSSPTGPSWRR